VGVFLYVIQPTPQKLSSEHQNSSCLFDFSCLTDQATQAIRVVWKPESPVTVTKKQSPNTGAGANKAESQPAKTGAQVTLTQLHSQPVIIIIIIVFNQTLVV